MPYFFHEKATRSKNTMNPKAPLKWVLMDILPSTASNVLTRDTTFSNYPLIFDAYYKILKLYGMEKITTEEVMDRLDMFQYIFGNNFSRCRIAIYTDGVQRRMPNLRSSFDVSGSVSSGNECKSRSYMENVVYNFTLSYVKC